MAKKEIEPKGKDTTVFKERTTAVPTEGIDVEAENGVKKLIFEKDDPKRLTKVTNTGIDIYGEKVAWNKKTDKPAKRTVMIMGNTITMEANEAVLVSDSLLRFFSGSMGFEHETQERK